MGSPFDAPADQTWDDPEPLPPWVHYVRWTLIGLGLVYFVLGLGLGGTIGVGMAVDPAIPYPQGLILGGGIGTFTFGLCTAFGVLNLVASRGLNKGRKWGWFVAMVLAAIYLGSACIPFGVVILVGLLRDDVRGIYLGKG